MVYFWILIILFKTIRQAGLKADREVNRKENIFHFFKKSICGNYQLFFSNHDANLLWFYPGLIHHIIKELVYSSYIHVSDEQHKITCELKSNKTFVLNCPLIRSDGVLICPHACSLGWRMVRSRDFDRWPVQQ